jgi:predicted nucleotidyltransferase
VQIINPAHVYPASLAAVMQDVEPVLLDLEIDFYVIGAVARDIWLTHEAGSVPRRMTRDVDLAISIPNEMAYEQLLTALEATGRFHKIRSSVFALIHTATGTTLDLMPFGGIADPQGNVRVARSGLEQISTVGFSEMAANAVAVQIQDRVEPWRIASIPALLLLKLLAWEDRPEERGKDATDIALILHHYLDLAGDRLYDQHYDLLADPELDERIYSSGIAAHIAGRELRTLLKTSVLLPRVSTLLTAQVSAGATAPFVRAMMQGTEWESDDAYRILTRLVLGFDEAPMDRRGY